MHTEFAGSFARIKVIGVGGAGGNAINRMIEAGVEGIEFISVNTDGQALLTSLAPVAVRIGDKLTKGPRRGRAAQRSACGPPEESSDQLAELVRGRRHDLHRRWHGRWGPGPGASPVIARLAKAGRRTHRRCRHSAPFEFEGNRRSRFAEEGVNALRDNVDALSPSRTSACSCWSTQDAD
jgi:cell division protein FtsZ